jgi:hypothetical protein
MCTPLVEAPVPNDRNPHQVHFVKNVPQRSNGTFQNRRVGDIKIVTEFPQEFPGCNSFVDALFRKVDVLPPCKQVFQIPVTLTVTAE